MDATAVADIRPASGAATWRRATVLILLALLAVGFVVTWALPYLSLEREALGRYWPRRGGLVIHVISGIVAILVGPVQLWLGLTGRRVELHRTLGATYVGSVVVGSVAAFYLAYNTTLGWGFGFGISGLAVAWVLTTGLAVAAIRRHLVFQHREWMIRSYVVTFAFVTFRMCFGILAAMKIGTVQEQLAMASWFCWAIPLLITECVLQGRKIFAVS